MNIQDLGAIGELIAAIATMGTLVYLALQVRANTRTSSSDNETEYQVRWNTMQDTMWGTTEMANIYLRGSLDMNSLSPEEAIVFGNWLGKMVDVQRIGMRMHEKGLLKKDLYEAGNNAVVAFLKTPGARQWWKVSSHFYIHRDFIDALIARPEPGPMTDLIPWIGADAESKYSG